MTIERINPVPQSYSPKPGNKEAAPLASSNLDKIQISTEAKQKLQDQKLAVAKANLEAYLQDGAVREDVLDKISAKIADEYFHAS